MGAGGPSCLAWFDETRYISSASECQGPGGTGGRSAKFPRSCHSCAPQWAQWAHPRCSRNDPRVLSWRSVFLTRRRVSRRSYTSRRVQRCPYAISSMSAAEWAIGSISDEVSAPWRAGRTAVASSDSSERCSDGLDSLTVLPASDLVVDLEEGQNKEKNSSDRSQEGDENTGETWEEGRQVRGGGCRVASQGAHSQHLESWTHGEAGDRSPSCIHFSISPPFVSIRLALLGAFPSICKYQARETPGANSRLCSLPGWVRPSWRWRGTWKAPASNSGFLLASRIFCLVVNFAGRWPWLLRGAPGGEDPHEPHSAAVHPPDRLGSVGLQDVGPTFPPPLAPEAWVSRHSVPSWRLVVG